MINDLQSFTPKSTEDIRPKDRVQAILNRFNTGLTVNEIEYLLPNFVLTDNSVCDPILIDTILHAVKVYKNKN